MSSQDKTQSVKESEIDRSWHLIDVSGKVLGRQATKIASFLIGKHKVYYTPHMDCGDYVVVTNASQVELTRGKEKKKMYYRHSGYPGGFKAERFDQLQKRYPEKIIREAVRRMLPKNKLGARMITRLKVYSGAEHPHQAQLS